MRWQITSFLQDYRDRTPVGSLLLALLAALLLAACGGEPPDGTASATPAAVSTPRVVRFHEVPETLFAQPLEPLPEGAFMVRGIYDRYGQGEQGLDLCELAGGVLRCRHYPATLEGAAGPLLVEVIGQIADGQMAVSTWQPVTWDETASRKAAVTELASRAEQIFAFDWSLIARPDFAESSAWFHWQPEEVAATAVELFAYDMAGDRVIWRAQGREMPQQRHLVHRFPVLYFFTDLTSQDAVETFMTIEGYVEE